MTTNHDKDGAIALWAALSGRLDASLPEWTNKIEEFGQVAAVERREAGSSWSDDEVFEALLRAVLSNHTDWAKIERVLPELRGAFADYSLNRYAETTDQDVEERLVPWFKERRAGSMTLRKGLINLAQAAQLLLEWSSEHGSAEHFFLQAVESCGGDPKRAAAAIGTAETEWKLPGLGIPLASETLRNLGFDVCKPDRHVCRAMGAFQLVQFKNWADRDRNKAPFSSADEMLETMRVVETLARDVGVRPTYFDNALWLACAQMGLRMSNAELAELASPEPGLRFTSS